jgi:uncharacterized membrane protein (UPF0182 family)
MMHFFKILFRVLIPTTEDLKSFLVFICAVLVLLVLCIGILGIFVIVVSIIKWIFGEVIAGVLLLSIMIIGVLWPLVINPLYCRYKRIEQEINQEKN